MAWNHNARATALVATALFAIGTASAGQVVLNEFSGQCGVIASNDPAANYMPGLAHMISGGAVGDFNQDGWQDIFFASGGATPDRLFINLKNGLFEDRAAEFGLTDLHMGAGAAVGDYNNDGWPDLFVASYGPSNAPMATGQHRLYRNNGGVGFTEVAALAGVNWSDTTPNAFGATFSDYDLDGDLDLFVTGWFADPPASSGGNRLFRNNGDETFSDVTVEANLNELGIHGFTPIFADMDGDLYPELLLAADFDTAQYYRNRGDGTFKNATAESGTGLDCNAMGAAIGDFNNDGQFDWYISNIYRGDQFPNEPCGNTLYINQGDNAFVEIGAAAGVIDGRWGWGTVAIDFDLDGDEDLAEVNGFADGDFGPDRWSNQPAKLFINQGGLSFTEEAAAAGFSHTGQGRGLVHLDLDNDGDQDLVVFSSDEEAVEVYRNDTVTSNGWVRLFFDTRPNDGIAPHGTGTRVELVAGGATQYRYLHGGSSYLSQSELSAHFGLGAATEVESLTFYWTNGQVSTRSSLTANQTLTIRPPGDGDLDRNGIFAADDVLSSLSCLAGPQNEGLTLQCAISDLNGDGDVDLADYGLAQALAL